MQLTHMAVGNLRSSLAPDWRQQFFAMWSIHEAANNMAAGFSQNKAASFYNLVLELTTHYFC